MRLYSGSSEQFIEDNMQNQIAEKMKESFFSYFRYNASPAEIRSWRNSLRSMALIIQKAEIKNKGILLEYQLPMTSKRLDCMICGEDRDKNENAVIVELKQWESCEDADSDRVVRTFVGGGNREVLHPSVQVDQYKQYLKDVHTAFYNEKDHIKLSSCAYLHNYSYNENDILYEIR